MSNSRFMGGAALLAVGLAVLGVACRPEKEASASSDGSKNYEAERVQPTLFTVPADQLAHLKITSVGRTTWAVNVHTTGTVDWDADQTTQAITQVSGPIARILVDMGAQVTEGQPLLYVASPDVSNAVSAYKKARNRLDLAERTMRRDHDLLEHKALAPKDFESAQADYNDANTDVQNSLQALKIYGLTKEGLEEADRQGGMISPQLAVRSPISGSVVQKLVLPGQLIQAGVSTCFLISNLSTVWVQGNIFDKDLESVRIGDPVEVTNPAYPNPFRGKVSYIGAMVDPATRTTPVRIVTRNPGGRLKKDMFVDAVIHTRDMRNILVVPTSAILHNTENEPFVYLEVGQGRFAQRLVTVGVQRDNEMEITSGLREGDSVVSEGSVFLQFANSFQ